MTNEICLNPAFADDDSIEDVLNQEYAKGYQQGKEDTINEMKSLIYEFDDYCDAMDCYYCWMNSGDESCLKQWIDRKFEQLKEQNESNNIQSTTVNEQDDYSCMR